MQLASSAVASTRSLPPCALLISVPLIPLEHTAAVTLVPLDDIVASSQGRDVGAPSATNDVEAVAAAQDIVPLAPQERIIADAAVERQLDDSRRQCGRRDRVL